jgi:hypothetical protein
MAENSFDTGFELLPADGPEVSPDEELAAAIADTDPATTIQPPQPLGRGWAFDPARGQFITYGSEPVRVSGEGELREWIDKALHTARFAHPIYSDQFGIDTVELIGRTPTADLVASHIQAIKDALLAHDRITDVKDFKVSADPSTDYLAFAFTVVLDEGPESTTIDLDPIDLGA